MHFVFLLPIKPTLDESHACRISKAISTSFGRDNVVLGLNEDDAKGHSVASQLSAHVVSIAARDPFPMCELWMMMAEYAYHEMEADIVMLVGDDLRIIDKDLMLQEVLELWRDGNQCIAVREKKSPSWPTFLALEAQAFVLDEFLNSKFMTHFINQDADPFAFEYFRRLGGAAWTRKIYVENETGGVYGGKLLKKTRRLNL